LTNLPRSRTLKQSSLQKNIAERSGTITSRCPICEHEGAQDLLKAPDRFHGRTQLYQLLRCPSCSVVWTDHPPRPEEMHLHYGTDYERLIAAAGENSPERWQIHRRNLAQYKSGGALLDLGCSTGSFLASLKGEPWNLYGIEISPECAKRAEANSGAEVFAGDVLAAPFPPETFDAITCFDVFEHVYYPRQVMEKVWQWLKPGGIFYAFMPNIDSAGARIFRSYWYALELPRHLYHFSPASLKLLAKRVGFSEVSITTQRALFIEYSTHYICDEILRRLGPSRAPLAVAKDPSILWRVIRKALRLTIFPLLSQMAVVVGDGEGMYAILRKEAPRPVLEQDDSSGARGEA
jgi:SAM-dependent methyltransferase